VTGKPSRMKRVLSFSATFFMGCVLGLVWYGLLAAGVYIFFWMPALWNTPFAEMTLKMVVWRAGGTIVTLALVGVGCVLSMMYHEWATNFLD
jgi:hypothetical protein